MRNAFTKSLRAIATSDKKIVFITGDLGFNAFEILQTDLGKRFINAGVAEHNMITAAAGMAYTGLKPWVYSIAPFITIKVLEEIRNDVCLTKADVKIVGLGGGYDYGLAGPTHHALQDVAAILTLPDIKIYAPGFVEDIPDVVNKMYREKSPSYIRLTKGEPTSLKLSPYAPCRQIIKGTKITVVVLGSIIRQVISAILENKIKKNLIDLWLISELPNEIPQKLFFSIFKTKKLCVIEEHVATGALGQFLSQLLISKKNIPKKFIHLHAKGYASKKYGGHEFYLKQTGLDKDSIARVINQNL